MASPELKSIGSTEFLVEFLAIFPLQPHYIPVAFLLPPHGITKRLADETDEMEAKHSCAITEMGVGPITILLSQGIYKREVLKGLEE